MRGMSLPIHVHPRLDGVLNQGPFNTCVIAVRSSVVESAGKAPLGQS